MAISSSLFLPELVPSAETKGDIMIKVERNRNLLGAHPDLDHPYAVNASEARLDFSQVGTFFIKEGREIVVFPLPGIEERLLRLPLLGASLAVLLYQRGKFVLHASAVKINDAAVAFVGNKGDGKSTMAAMLHELGHQLLADDTVAIDFEITDRPTALSGFPQFKLYPDAVVAALKDDPERLEEIASNVDKRSRAAEKFCSQNLPLKGIFVLKEGAEIRINRLSPQESIKNLIAHSYMARFTDEWLRSGIAATNLKHCIAAVNQVPIYELIRPRDLARLEDVAIALEEWSLTTVTI